MDASEHAKEEKSQAEDGATTKGAGTNESAGQTKDNRVKRIADYLESSLRKPDALQATIGAVNSDLMLIGHRLNQAVQHAMDTSPTALNEFGKLMPAVESLLKVYKQVDRFTQLEVRMTKADRTLANLRDGEKGAA